jgi:hypothetical protein
MDRVREAIDRQLQEGDLVEVMGDDGVVRYATTELGRLKVREAIAHQAITTARQVLANLTASLEWADSLLHTDPPPATFEEIREQMSVLLPPEPTSRPQQDNGYL